MEFNTRVFKGIEFDQIDTWLNRQLTGGYSVVVVGYSLAVEEAERSNVGQRLAITVKRWKRGEVIQDNMQRQTIDDIPQEPSIDYSKSR